MYLRRSEEQVNDLLRNQRPFPPILHTVSYRFPYGLNPTFYLNYLESTKKVCIFGSKLTTS